MPTTPKGITYPSNSSPVAVPADIQQAAEDVDGMIVPSTGGTYTGAVSFTQSPSVPAPTSGLHAVNKTYADAINTDVTALETELGTNPSGTFSTVVQRLDSYTDGFTKIGNLLTSNQALVADTSGVAPGANNPTIARVADSNAYGGYAIEATAASTGLFTISWSNSLDISHSSSTVTPGQQITVHFSIRNSVGTRSTRAYIAWMNSGKTLLSESFSQYVTSGTFTTVVLTAIVPANAAYLNLLIYSNTGAVGDKVLIERPGIWFGASSVWQPPGTPIVGQSHIAINNAVHLSGTGSPESVISAAPGSTYLQTDSVTDVKGWIRWIKATGTGNTGWIAGPEADTGWRQIVSWAGGVQDGTNQVGTIDTTQYSLSGTGGIWIRRIGQYVEWWLHGAITKTNSGSHKLFTVDNRIPSGFRADGQATYGVSVPLSHTVDFLGTYGIGDTPSFGSTAGGFNLAWHSCRHYTSNSWPTSLPGTAA